MAQVKLSLYSRIIAGNKYYIDLMDDDTYAITMDSNTWDGVKIVKRFTTEAPALEFFKKMN